MTPRKPQSPVGAPKARKAAARRSSPTSDQMQPTSLRVLGYARVSTREQANGHSLEAQRTAMEQWCAMQNPPAELVTIHIDVMSTRRTERMHGRTAAVAAIASGAADALLVRAIDRATRSVHDGALLLEQCAAERVRLLTVDGYDSADEDTQLIANVKIAFAQEERRLISRRTREGLARARAAGQTLGKVSTVPDEVAVRIGEARRAGESYRAIAAALDADGIPTPGGSERWRPAAVRDIYRRTSTEAVDAFISRAVAA